ncbi:MAG: hypothetical protein VKN83_00290 [Cyanobacteriota bacterium]|jgi:hypothetical protein|nr:hypothetical protein [Cyanobacteriota bacterium]
MPPHESSQVPEPPGPDDRGCGGKPRRFAIGIAPLGVVSIGIVPMGVVSIGVVPMGVLSIGAVGMGLVNLCVVGMGVLVAGVNVMGVWWAGVEGMGVKRLAGGPAQGHHSRTHPHSHGLSTPAASDNFYAYPSKAEALDKASELGCTGAHAMGKLWMPCEAHPMAPSGGQGVSEAP